MQICPFCGFPVPTRPRADTGGQRCQSPLVSIAHTFRATREPFGRRSAPRLEKNCSALPHISPPATPVATALRDLSLTGVSLITPTDATIRIEAPGVEAIAHLIKVRFRDDASLVRDCLLTALYSRKSGVFVSETV